MKIPELKWPAAPQPYDEDLLLEIQPGTAVLLIRGRNAWNSTWVRHYLKNSELYTTVDAAKLGAEEQRGPGNVFYIIEAPAILLSGAGSHVVLCDTHPDNPFGAFKGFDTTVNVSAHGNWIAGLFPGVSVQDAVASFHHRSGHWSGPIPSEHSLRTGRLDTPRSFDAKVQSMQSLVSGSVGSSYYLQWDLYAQGKRYIRRGANEVARQWARLIDGVRVGHAADINLSECLQRHRQTSLNALPWSQWTRRKQQIEAARKVLSEEAFERWSIVAGRKDDLECDLEEAESELTAARLARTIPAATSAGVREQRERVEAAQAEITRIAAELAEAKAQSDDLWKLYMQARSSGAILLGGMDGDDR